MDSNFILIIIFYFFLLFMSLYIIFSAFFISDSKSSTINIETNNFYIYNNKKFKIIENKDEINWKFFRTKNLKSKIKITNSLNENDFFIYEYNHYFVKPKNWNNYYIELIQ